MLGLYQRLRENVNFFCARLRVLFALTLSLGVKYTCAVDQSAFSRQLRHRTDRINDREKAPRSNMHPGMLDVY